MDQLHITLDRKQILRDAHLEAAKGDTVGLVGSNGSGKSTLLRTVYRSLRPADGVARVGGDDVGELSARTAARRTAAVLQDAGTTIGLSVTEIVALGRTPHHALTGRGGAEDREAVAEAVARCGVGPFADRDHATLSGGEERQRVLPARTLVQRPRLLVLDELTNHLDIRARFEILDLIRSTGITTLAVLRDLDLAARLRDHLVVLHEDVVVAAGPVPGGRAGACRAMTRPHPLCGLYWIPVWCSSLAQGPSDRWTRCGAMSIPADTSAQVTTSLSSTYRTPAPTSIEPSIFASFSRWFR
ncbi:ABC transporter ATP-binding protein [Streptomyces mirabilis]|uniref:ABC transporter ATP-binding protein n=1 Tax=Streptomyces mirabilis TaxID=68239 RepID=UPI0036AE7DAF